MTLSIVVLNQEEEFLQHLDPELCDLKETCKANGLRTLNLEYKFQDMKEDKELFRIGNKIWIQGDTNLTDCLYLINTSVKQDIFKDNSFTLELEEVLVELTYAPLVAHTELTTSNGFKKVTQAGYNTTDVETFRVDYNSLCYLFGDYYNIGVVQDCLSDYAQQCSLTGTITRMALLRQIEEDTGNVFITRYEKDSLNNTIHRYLDFLNPIDVNKNWRLNLEYKFLDLTTTKEIYDADDNLTTEDLSWAVTPFDTTVQEGSLNESVADATHDGNELYNDDEDTARSEYWASSEQTVNDPEYVKEYPTYTNIVPANCVLRITDGEHLLNKDGNIWESGDTALQWTSQQIGLTNNTQTTVITLVRNGSYLGMTCNNKSFTIDQDNTDTIDSYVPAFYNEPGTALTVSYIQEDSTNTDVTLPDDSCFEIYDTVNQIVVYRTVLNFNIGTVHEQVLDFGFNLEDITHEINETDTYTAVAPILELSENNSDDETKQNGLNKTQLGWLINNWRNLDVKKGDTIPMIVEKVTYTGASLESIKRGLGDYVNNSGANQSTSVTNWWKRPYNPNDQINDNDNNTYEFLRATAYWKAPYTKHKGDLYVETDKTDMTEYQTIHERGDKREEKGMIAHPKAGTTNSSDEDIFQIYNQVATYLKDHEEPEIDIDFDVANLRGMSYNNYQIWDKVYVKVPDTGELIQARVTEISKEAHDVAKNTVKITNTQKNSLKVSPIATGITVSNVGFKYPATKKFVANLKNLENNTNLKNKLLNFTLYIIDDNGGLKFRKNTVKKTNSNGNAIITLNYKPGNYKLKVSFSGDEQYEETRASAKVNVWGQTTTSGGSTDKSTKSKTTTSKKTEITYYDKFGRSPDNTKILAIGRRSNGHDSGDYGHFYGQEFKNYCPKCHKSGTLAWSIYYAGNEHADKGIFPATGKREGSSAEGAIVCTNQICDGDYSCQGHEHGYQNKTLTTTKKRFVSSKSDAYKLKAGKYIYEKKVVETEDKKVESDKSRKTVGNISSVVKNKALEIVKDKTGQEAMKEIVKFMDKKIKYSGYANFKYPSTRVLKKGRANCCDGTRLFLELCDGAGLTDYYELYYKHVKGHIYAVVKSKSTHKKVNVDNASDYNSAWGYVCKNYRNASVIKVTRYPTRPM